MIIIKILSYIFIAMATQVFPQDPPAVDVISTDAGDVEMHFIGHGSLMFQVNDFRIYIDPVRSIGNYDISKKADLILVTHEHSDHLDPELIEDLSKAGTIVMANLNAASRVKGAKTMKAGDVENIIDITIEAVPAYNIVNMRSPGQPFHPKGVGNGYILTIGDKRIYVAGDTENIPEMKALKNIYVAFLPMNLPYTMTPEMVADAALAFKPQILYPYHYSNTDTNELVKLLKDTGIEVRIRNLQ
ncbi:MAG TPA: MBL fold metallo-hydrolase [Bacteroidales bacterium]|nr:MBL fold metallo-hydrolase [Bacteroidales bacterium]HPR72553.1 MBL fold metallo-hydrolase [Bacteroidales bacterium]